jgi:putative intracellular protease/amidase
MRRRAAIRSLPPPARRARMADMDIAIPLYDDFTALDAIGPYEVLSRLPEARVRFVGPEARPYRTDRGLAVVADAVLEDVPRPEILLVPGGTVTRALLHDERLLNWIRGAAATAGWTTSVCTGSLLLGAAGLLRGLRATTHWLEMDALAGFGAEAVSDRVVVEGRVVTAAGVSSGIDMALWLARELAGDRVAEAVQLIIEYDPQPPLDCGSVAKAPAELVEAMRGGWRASQATA